MGTLYCIMTRKNLNLLIYPQTDHLTLIFFVFDLWCYLHCKNHLVIDVNADKIRCDSVR